MGNATDIVGAHTNLLGGVVGSPMPDSWLPGPLKKVSDLTNPLKWFGGPDSTGYTNQGNEYRVGDVATEGINEHQNSLTQMIRSISNLTGTAGKGALQAGGGVFQRGVSDMGGPEKFWNAILGGDRTAMSDTLAPEVSTIVSQYDAGRKAMQQFSGRGGGKNSYLAELPMRQAGDVQKLIQQMRPEAARQMTTIAQMLASLGLNQQQIGTTLLGLTNQSLHAMRGQDVQVDMANRETVASAGEGLGKIIASLFGGKG